MGQGNWLSQLDDANWIALVTAVFTFLGIVVGLVAIIWQLRGLNRQLTLQLFADYTKRYQEIVQRFPEDINDKEFSLEGRTDYTQTMRAMRTYFDLCFEEWFLSRRRLIDHVIWQIWCGGMRTALSKPAFQQAWKRIVRDTEYGQKFEEFVADLLPDDHLSSSNGTKAE